MNSLKIRFQQWSSITKRMNNIIEVASLATCWSSDGHLQEAKHWTLLAGLVAVGLPQTLEAPEQRTL